MKVKQAIVPMHDFDGKSIGLMNILLGTLGKYKRTNFLMISVAVASALMMSGFHGQMSAPAPAFMKSAQAFSGNRGTWGIDCADVNGDSAPDVVLASLADPSLLLLNDGKGRFKESSQVFPHDLHDVALGDLDNDGDVDLFLVSVRNEKRPVYLNDGESTFTNTSFKSEASETVQLVDVENDGDLDAYCGSRGTIYVNDGKGNFSVGSTSLPGFALLADFNGDGFVDLIGMGEEKEEEVLRSI